MPQQFAQVTGGSCRLTLYRESAPGKVTDTNGVVLALMQEGFKRGSSKKQRTVISGKRGNGKPYAGMPQISGSLDSPAYAPQLGHLLRALCGAPATAAVTGKALDAAAVLQLEAGFVGLPCAAHGFLQDAAITVVGTTHYNGTYRVEEGTTADMIAVAAPYVAEILAAGARVVRGRAPFLSGAARDLGGGKVGLPTAGGVHALNAGESVTIEGTTHYNGTHTLDSATTDGLLAITATYEAETFDGSPVALPVFYAHTFALPKKQPTVCVEKYLDFDAGASTTPYHRYHFCKVNGIKFDLGGDSELKFSVDFTAGREVLSATPLDASPDQLPSVPMEGIEGSIFVAGARRGDVEKASVSNSFGVEAKSAVGDRGQYSRMPEGDPDSKVTLSVFLEQDDLQALVEASSTVPVMLAICAVTGDELHVSYPESELDSDGPAIDGKGGLMQDFTVLPFVDKGNSVLTFVLINRVSIYA